LNSLRRWFCSQVEKMMPRTLAIIRRTPWKDSLADYRCDDEL
jgi:hypothetical protein